MKHRCKLIVIEDLFSCHALETISDQTAGGKSWLCFHKAQGSNKWNCTYVADPEIDHDGILLKLAFQFDLDCNPDSLHTCEQILITHLEFGLSDP